MMDRTSGQSGTSTPRPGAGKPISEQIELLRADMSGLADKVTGITKEQFNATVSDVQNVALDKTKDLKNSIRANPMQATVAAVGIGFVLGLLLTR